MLKLKGEEASALSSALFWSPEKPSHVPLVNHAFFQKVSFHTSVGYSLPFRHHYLLYPATFPRSSLLSPSSRIMPDVQQKSQAYSVQEPEEEEVAEDFILGPASSVRFARLTAPGIRNRRGFAVDPVHGTRKANGEKRGRNIDQRRPLTDQRKVVWFCTSEIPDLAAHRFIPFNKTWIYVSARFTLLLILLSSS